MENILTMKNITKIYGGVTALNHVNLELRKGEILGLVGENGAGKSTLIKTLSGAVVPDAGTIFFEGTEYTKLSPVQSKELGIAIVYQELNLCPSLTVYENIFLGSFRGKAGFVNNKEMRKEAEKLLLENEIPINPEMQVSNLTVAQMQMLEIAKSVSSEVKVLILDEPTGTLTAKETENLFRLMKRLKEKGTSMIYISHHLNEIFKIADRVTIMRDGNVIETHDVDQISEELLIQGMIGRKLSNSYPVRKSTIGKTILKVDDLSGTKAKHVSFELHKGEVLGIGGLVGAGRTELMKTIFAADPVLGGRIFLDGKEIKPSNPLEAVKEGISMVPEDRKGQGVILGLPLLNNICMSIYKRISHGLFVNQKKEKEVARQYIDSLKIKTPNEKFLAGNLSGGNQQKVVLAKCLAAQSRILILDEPTRGIDVGAKYEFYKLINDLAEQGIGILMVSSEMDELLGMSDRILMMCEGRQTGILEKEEFSQENIFRYATKYSEVDM